MSVFIKFAARGHHKRNTQPVALAAICAQRLHRNAMFRNRGISGQDGDCPVQQGVTEQAAQRLCPRGNLTFQSCNDKQSRASCLHSAHRECCQQQPADKRNRMSLPQDDLPGASRRMFLGGSVAAAAGAAMLATPVAARAAQQRLARSIAKGPVWTQSGPVTGVPSVLSGVTVFKGIPYAGSTAGNNRFRPPTPAPLWSGVRKADTWGAACTQPVDGIPAAQVPVLSEDCLNLNVWTAAESADERRPVFMWLYGGRGSAMWTSQPIYGGAGLARKGLVVVTVNCRVGPLGGLCTPGLSDESGRPPVTTGQMSACGRTGHRVAPRSRIPSLSSEDAGRYSM
jgi:hypothetical protein